MSADNLVYALPFQKATGESVWRVLEVQLSSLPWDLVYAMSSEGYVRQFQEFRGENAKCAAIAAARKLERELPICEYGLTIEDPEQPLTMAQLQQAAVESGYPEERVFALREASDEELSDREAPYWQSL